MYCRLQSLSSDISGFLREGAEAAGRMTLRGVIKAERIKVSIDPDVRNEREGGGEILFPRPIRRVQQTIV
jgi:hypothetical protein